MNPDEAKTLLGRIDSLRHPCDLDLLIFFVKHPNTLMGSEQLATFMGYDLNQQARSLDVLLDAGLVTRSQTRGRVARMYVHAGGGIHAAWLPALVALAATRGGRLALMQALKARSSARRPTHPFLIRPKPDAARKSERRLRGRGGQ
jgi:hypothetical protein